MKIALYNFNIDSLYVTKLFAASYNILVLFILNLVTMNERAGDFLFSFAAINMCAVFVRLGSDNYWLKSSGLTLRRTKHDFSFITVITALGSLILYLKVPNFSGGVHNLILIFCIIACHHFIALIAKSLQVHKYHHSSLFLQLLGGGFLAIPFFLVLDCSHLLSIFLSNSLVAGYCFFWHRKRVSFEYVNASFFERFNYLPLIYFGALNQNLISVVGGLYALTSQLPSLVLVQRFFGFASWPAAIYLQRALSGLSQSEQLRIPARTHVTRFWKSSVLPTCILSAILVFVFLWYLFFTSQLSFNLVFSIVSIQVACLVSALCSLTPQLLSIHNKGLRLVASLFFACFGVLLVGLSVPNAIMLAFCFLVFHVIFASVNHNGIVSL